METTLQVRLRKWYESIDALKPIEENLFNLEGSEKSLYSKLFLSAEGKNVAEKEAAAYAHEDYTNLQAAIAPLKTERLRLMRLVELQQKAFDAEYLELKLNNTVIKKS